MASLKRVKNPVVLNLTFDDGDQFRVMSELTDLSGFRLGFGAVISSDFLLIFAMSSRFGDLNAEEIKAWAFKLSLRLAMNPVDHVSE